MANKFLTVLFGDPNKKMLEGLRRDADKVTAFEPAMTALSDEELKAKTAEFKARLGNGETLDDLAHEAFAVVREAAKRTLAQRHYDVQLMGGLVLHRRGIAEMRTGEGKTLTATAPLYLNALAGKGSHLVTVNDYLARRDAAWMAQVFHFLGMSVGVIQGQQVSYLYDPDSVDTLRPATRREAYAADITYGTNNEFGFDYLRDNMAPTLEQKVMGETFFAIVDEVDSILIDEARTPLLISAPAEESNQLYYRFAQISESLVENVDYNVDEKMRAATLSEEGISKIERALGIENLYASSTGNLQYFADNALRAKALYKKDVHYVVKDDEVIIVDEFTGRLMPGRRFSEGQHQAIEAKEGVKIQRESQTLATITFQNLFRMYGKLAGMTGTAATEAEEFGKIYDLDVTIVPTNKEPARSDLSDRIYKNESGKYAAIVQEVKARHEKGQPVLIGTASIEKNELMAELLTRAGIPFNMLNAKNHEREAEFIAQAGRVGAVTLATNMAGRGVDIMLGGNPPDPVEAEKVKELGGLFVLGTERHESRRIDNQLRGRAGRQGDPGETQFYISMEDDLMRIFGSDRVRKIMDTLKIPDDMPIENGMISNSIEKAQVRVEGHHFDTRKHLLEYDDVLNKHREVIYERRDEVLTAFAESPETLKDKVLELIEGEVEQVVLFHTGESVAKPDVPEQFRTEPSAPTGSDHDTKEIGEVVATLIPLTADEKKSLNALVTAAGKDKMHAAVERTALIEAVMAMVRAHYDAAEAQFTDKKEVRNVERAVILRTIDTLWIDHLASMTALRHGIGLRGYGQRDPLVEYKKEAYLMFQNLLGLINTEIVYTFFKAVRHTLDAKAAEILTHSLLDRAGVQLQGAVKGAPQSGTPSMRGAAGDEAIPSSQPKIGRNDACPCGSGKKYKKCHGT